MKAIVSRNELLAAVLFASEDDARYVINSVLLEIKPGAPPKMVATDGRRLVVIETSAEQEDDFRREHSLILRTDSVKPICALSKALGTKWIGFENRQGSQRVSVGHAMQIG